LKVDAHSNQSQKQEHGKLQIEHFQGLYKFGSSDLYANQKQFAIQIIQTVLFFWGNL